MRSIGVALAILLVCASANGQELFGENTPSVDVAVTSRHALVESKNAIMETKRHNEIVEVWMSQHDIRLRAIQSSIDKVSDVGRVSMWATPIAIFLGSLNIGLAIHSAAKKIAERLPPK